jgi:hypothetical protein
MLDWNRSVQSGSPPAAKHVAKYLDSPYATTLVMSFTYHTPCLDKRDSHQAPVENDGILKLLGSRAKFSATS